MRSFRTQGHDEANSRFSQTLRTQLRIKNYNLDYNLEKTPLRNTNKSKVPSKTNVTAFLFWGTMLFFTRQYTFKI
jgi:hypothetical protein